MIKNLTYKQKVIYFGIVTFFFLLIIFQLSIKKTINLKRSCKFLKSQLENLSSAPDEINLIQNKILVFENSIGSKINDNQSVQEIILEKSSKFCQENNIVITEFLRPHLYQNQKYIIETNVITVEGSFKKLLKFVYQFEQFYKIGKVTSVNFFTYKDNKTRKLRLAAKLYIQNIKIYENN